MSGSVVPEATTLHQPWVTCPIDSAKDCNRDESEPEVGLRLSWGGRVRLGHGVLRWGGGEVEGSVSACVRVYVCLSVIYTVYIYMRERWGNGKTG